MIKKENQVVESLLTHGASKLGVDVAKSRVAAFYCGSGDRCFKQDGENPLDVGEGESVCFLESTIDVGWKTDIGQCLDFPLLSPPFQLFLEGVGLWEVCSKPAADFSLLLIIQVV